jgi:osmoprotectant transport system substrate-binding protein
LIKLHKHLLMLTISLITILAILSGCGRAAETGRVVVGSKDFTENVILGEMLSLMIEHNTNIKVTRRLNLGGTKVTFDGVKSGNLDMYVEYDGTAYGAHLAHKEMLKDPATLYDAVNKELGDQFQMTLTKPMGFNNTYALAMPKNLADQYHIKTYSDLAKQSDKFVFGTTSEFIGRQADGYNPLVKAYGFKFKDVRTMSTGLRYTAIAQNDIQVMDAYSTDGKLKEFNLVVLEDDKKFFPPYNGAPLVREETLAKNPELRAVLDKLGGTLTDDSMLDLNYRVEVKGEDPEDVAKDFLLSKGLIK